MVNVNSHSIDGGASYSCFRLSCPKTVPTTAADRIAARLVALLERGTYESVVNMRYMKRVPPRLASSAALRDTVALLCSAWTGSRRRRPVEELVALGVYGKALRSLQRALSSGPEQLSCETLAAVTIMERFIVLFNRGNRASRILHGQGIRVLMEQRGPPNGEDELDLLLTIENQGSMVCHDLQLWCCLYGLKLTVKQLAHSVLSGTDNLYLQPTWRDALAQARLIVPDEAALPGSDIIDACFSRWPELTREMMALYEPSTTGSECLRARVKAVQKKLGAVQEMTPTIHDHMARMRSLGQILEVDTLETPLGSKYECTTLEGAEMILGCITLRIIWNRMQHELLTTFHEYGSREDDDDEDEPDILALINLEEENREYGHEVAKFVPCLKERGPVVGGLLTMPLHLSLEGSDPPVGEYIMEFLSDVNETQQMFPKGIARLEEYLLDRARVLTGRCPVHCTVKAMDGEQINTI